MGHFMAHYWHIVCTKIAKNWTFFQLFEEKVTKIGVILTFLAKSAQKIGHYGRTENCKKLQKIELFFIFTIHLHCKVAEKWDIHGTYASSCGTTFCTKIELFFKNSTFFKIGTEKGLCKKLHFFWKLQYNCTVNRSFYGTYGPKIEFCGRIRCVQKIALFLKNCTFFEQNRRNSVFLPKNMAHYGRIRCVQKIALFFRFFRKKWEFPRK